MLSLVIQALLCLLAAGQGVVVRFLPFAGTSGETSAAGAQHEQDVRRVISDASELNVGED